MKTFGFTGSGEAPEDYVMGGASKIVRDVLQPDGQWDAFTPLFETQRKRVDVYGCVTFSGWNILETLHKRLYGEEINKSDRFTVVASGTVPNQGNSFKNVAECIRKMWSVDEAEHPFPEEISVDFYYKPITQEMIAQALKEYWYEVGYEWLPRANFGSSPYCTAEVLMDALKFAPVQVAVDGRYDYDENGYIGKIIGYNHGVMLYGYKKGEYWKVFDSYENEFKKFRWDYKFGFPLLYSLKKKFNMKLYKKVGEPAIYVKHWSKDLLVPFADGVEAGGDVFKTLYGITDYSQLPRENVEVLPYPVAEFAVTTAGLVPFGF